LKQQNEPIEYQTSIIGTIENYNPSN